MQTVIILHHHEITLKGDNRGFFEKQLLKNIRTTLSGLVKPNRVGGGYGKFMIYLQDNDNPEIISEKLSTVFGLANICVGLRVEQDVDKFCEAAEILLRDKQFKTIRVETRRPDKNFPVRSMEVNAKVGGFICDTFGVRANLSQPDETIYIEVVDSTAFVYCSKQKGAGGLPVGVSGRVVSLLSAGIDSPVSSWQMMKRGANVIFVHFHSMPYTSANSVDQVRQLTEVLTRYQYRSKLYLVPFAETQNEIVLQSPQPLRVIFYRRMMMRVAERIAMREKAEALVTGDAVGQVASQTLRNIRAINYAATLPILRPLSGFDKEETMAIARTIGTFDISKEPYDDCCSFLAPRKPATWANIDEVTEAESKLDVERLIQLSLEKTTFETFYYPTVEENALLDSTPA